MKKILLSLLFVAGIVALTACSGNKENNDNAVPSTGNEKVDEVVKKAIADMSGIEKFEYALQKGFNLSLKDVDPGFEYLEKSDKGSNYFFGEAIESAGTYRANAMFVKKDKADVSEEEYKAFVNKMYEATKKMAQDGKNIYGWEEADNEAKALTEKPADKLFENKFWPQGWAFRMNDKFYVVNMSLEDAKASLPARVKFSIGQGLQKSLSDSMDDAEKMLNDPEVQKAIKEKLGK